MKLYLTGGQQGIPRLDLDGLESKLESAGRGRCVVQAEKPSIMDTPMPDAEKPAQTPVPPAAPAPEPRHFALDLLQRQDFAQRRDARNFLEQYLWLGCRAGVMVGFVCVCVCACLCVLACVVVVLILCDVPS